MSAVDLRTGGQLRDYRLEAVVGRGGMSVVYVAEDLRLGRKVAIKLLAPELAGDDRFRERFVRESELAASIDHPNVIPIYEAGEADGRLYIAMRYVAGTDLKALLRREGALEPTRAVAIVKQLAAALDVAHVRGLVHRDVKPGNVLLTAEDGREHVYLSDFGVAKSASFATGLTTAGQRVGTIDYGAPEQIRGAGVDGRADQYSLGCLLFECLTGEVPFRRDTEVAVIYAHLRDEPQAVSGRLRAIPTDIDLVLARALAKRPGDRYESCRDLAAAAEAALGHSRRGTGASVLAPSKQRARSLRTHLLRVPIAGALLASFVFAVGGGGVSKPGAGVSSAAPLTGTYETRISGKTAEDAGLIGTWRVQFLPGGAVWAMWNGVTVVRGRVSVTPTQITFTDEAGSEACRGSEATGVYRWALRGGRLTFTALRDRCRPRRIVVLMRPWARVD
jgi:serine/threonine-protein kinase